MVRLRGNKAKLITVGKLFEADHTGNRIQVDYEYWNRPGATSGDVNFFYLNIFDESGTAISTEQGQGQNQNGQSFVGQKIFAKTGGGNFNQGDIFEVRFRPYAPEYGFYTIALSWVEVTIITV